jgi:acyl carrier protein phosphodiesterase
MNLLAHAYLSGDNENLMVGNFIADHIKGNKIGHLPPEVVQGIELHRAIDHYTDRHPVFNKSCNLLYQRYHKYAGIVVDIYYDHFLAKLWHHYHRDPLSTFTGYCYATLLRNYQILPQRTRYLLPHILMDDWLSAYGTFEGLERSFFGIARRVKYNPGLEHATEELKANYAAFENDFTTFFPDLIFFTNKKINDLNAQPVVLTRRLKQTKRRRRWMKLIGKKTQSGSAPKA